MADFLAAQGYAVLLPDSLGSRGVSSICTEEQRAANPVQVDTAMRRDDLFATLRWVREQPWADASRVAVLGWSHGAQTVLAATHANPSGGRSGSDPTPFLRAIAFYPGCNQAQRSRYEPNTPLTLLLGAEDDWTPPQPCIDLARQLAAKGRAVTLHVFEGAVHGFDTPFAGVREATGVPSRLHSGKNASVGQHPEAWRESWAIVRQVLRDAFGAP